MKSYTSEDGITIKVGENAKTMMNSHCRVTPKNGGCTRLDILGHMSSYATKVILYPKRRSGIAAVLALHHSKVPKTKMSLVDMIRVEQIHKYPCSNHGQVQLVGNYMTFTIFMDKEKPRLKDS